MHDRVAEFLARQEGHRMGLVRGPEAACGFENGWAKDLFPGARAAAAAHAGLLLYAGCWAEAHEIAQNVESAEGSYWHGIIHRQEPDAGNASYWMRKVGKHPIFEGLLDDAKAILSRYPKGGVTLGAAWDPFQFIELCERVRNNPGSAIEQAAVEIQHAEWVRLFDYCTHTV